MTSILVTGLIACFPKSNRHYDVNSQYYTHPILEEEITAIGGHYVLAKEVRLPHHGREILYLVGYAVLDSTCCGVGGCAYAIVPGFVLDWKFKKDLADRPVSEVNPIQDPLVQKEIRQLIQKKEMVHQVNFEPL